MNPLTLSVVIPTCKRPRELERALKSVLNQGTDILEIIVVDDNPPGSEARKLTEKLLSGIAGPVRHLKNEKSLGGGGARNEGIKVAQGDFVAFLDDDDEWLPGKLERQMAFFTGLPAEVACVDTGFVEINETTGTTKTVKPDLRGDIFEDLLAKDKGRAPKLSTLVCRREALVSVGMFDVSLPSRQDLDLYLRLARQYRFDFIGEPLARKYVHDSGRISSSYKNKIGGFDLLYKKYHSDLAARPRLHRIYLRQQARWLFKDRQYGKGLGKILKSLFIC